MRRFLIFLLMVLVLPACASLSNLQKAQVSHDALALAQDTEAALCYAKPLAEAMRDPAIIAAPNHCPSPQAAGVGLTDARHQAFNAGLKQALDAHYAVVRLLQQGVPADTAALNRLIAEVLALVAQLSPGNVTVQQLTTQLQHARLP